MTLFTLLIVMAFERVSTKTKELHAATWIRALIKHSEDMRLFSASASMLNTLIFALVFTFPVWLAVAYLPGFIVFLLHLILLWACLGCPVTRKTYKQYLQAANREDFQACSLYSEKFGNKGGDLSEVGKQLVLVNYRQYASVIIFFVVLGLPGMVFYSICKELYFYRRDEQSALSDVDTYIDTETDTKIDTNAKNAPSKNNLHAVEQILFVLDWLPARITAFGYLLVGHFGKGLPVWIEAAFDVKLGIYDLLAKVAKASEEISASSNPVLDEALQLVKLVKRNIVFLLMLISLMTMVGVVA